MNYTEEIPDYGDIMTIEEWNDCVEQGFFTNDDGSGYFCKDGKMDRTIEVFSPQAAKMEIDATHVCWFNK